MKYGITGRSLGSSTKDGKYYYAIENPHQNGKQIVTIEMRGQFVPFSVDLNTGRTYVHSAQDPESMLHEVVFTQGEWHLKASSKQLKKIKWLYSADDKKFLDVAVVRTKKGKPIYAQMDRHAGFLYGPKYRLNAKNELVKIKPNSVASARKKGGAVNEGHPHRHGHRVRGGAKSGRMEEIKVPGINYSGKVIKKPVDGSPYLQYYATTGGYSKPSETLVVSAHGGFIDSDTVSPPVVMPSGVTIKLLTPHETLLSDPGLEHFINPKPDFQAYVTLKNGVITDMNFVPQTGNDEWIPQDGYQPYDAKNTLGRDDGLQNYRHYRYEGESDEYIAKTLIDNRDLAAKGETPLADIITVNDEISDAWGTDPSQASVQRVIDLDKEGKLLNEQGERYKTIVFAHCRNNFLKPESSTSTYYMLPVDDAGASVTKGASLGALEVTALTRETVDQPFRVQRVKLRDYQFIPVIKKASTPASSSTAAL